MSKTYIKLFFVAFSISFLGTLPIGTLNTSVADYALKGNFKGAAEFGLAAILVEVTLVALALLALNKITHLQKLFKYLSAVICVVIFFFAYKSLEAAFHMKSYRDMLPFVGMNAFYAGLALSLLNPLHLPFWLSWTAVLKSRNILDSKPFAYNIYIIAIGTGTFSAFTIYGFAGNFLMNTLKAEHNLINWLLGLTLLLTGIILAYKLIAKKLQLGGVKSASAKNQN
jgi:threonine/homoserine/homoserine lactone efflux protein